METDNDAGAGEALEGVNRIHPVLDRLRDLLASATALDLKATARATGPKVEPKAIGR